MIKFDKRDIKILILIVIFIRQFICTILSLNKTRTAIYNFEVMVALRFVGSPYFLIQFSRRKSHHEYEDKIIISQFYTA